MLQIHRKAQLTGHNAAVFALAPAQEPRYFFSAAGDGWVVRWDMEEPDLGKLVAKVDNQLFALLYLPEDGKVIAGNMNGGLHWIDIDQPDRTRNIAHHKKGVYAIIRAGDSVLTAGGEGLLTRWSAEEGRSLESIQLSKMSLRGLDYSPLRNEIAAGASDHQIYVLDATTLAVKKTIPGAHANSVFSVRYSPDGRYLLSGGRDAFLRIWETENWSCLSEQPAHWYTINDIAFHPSGQYFATASRDKTIKIWDAATFQLLKVLDTIRDRCHVNSVNALLWSDYHGQLVSASDDRSLIIWG